MFRFVFLWLAAISLAHPSLAQTTTDDTAPEDPEIAAARQAVFDAPYDEQVIYSRRLIELIERKSGAENDDYAAALQIYSSQLTRDGNPAEAQQTALRAVEIFTRLHGDISSEVAFADHNYATILSINGFKEEALAPYGKYVGAITEIAYGCGKLSGAVFQGCTHDEGALGDALLGYARLFYDIGATQNGADAFDEALARFEPRWAGCDSENWGFSCADAAEKRRAIQSGYARFLEIAGRTEDALAMHRTIMMPQLQALSACPQESCDHDWRLINHFRSYTEFLTQNERAEQAFDLNAEWLPILANQPIYTRGKEPDARYADRGYAERVDQAFQDFSKIATELGRSEQARQTLASVGQGQVADETSVRNDYIAQIAALNSQLSTISASGTDYFEQRAPLLTRKAELNEKLYGADSHNYLTTLVDAGLSLIRTTDLAGAERAFRTAFDATLEQHGAGDFRTTSNANYLVETLIAQDRAGEARALLHNVLSDPDSNVMAIFTDPEARQALARGFSDPHRQLNDLHLRYAQMLMERQESGAAAWFPEIENAMEVALVSARHSAIGTRAYRQSFDFSYSNEQRLATDQISDSFAWRTSYRDRFLLYADALAAAGHTNNTAMREALLALQEITMGSTSRAVARAAAQKAAMREGATPLIEERAEIDAQLAILDQGGAELVEASELTRKLQRDATARARRRRELGITIDELGDSERARIQRLDNSARLQFRRFEINRELAALVPGYFDLVRPEALELEEAQALLGEDEALVMAVPSAHGAHMLVLTKTSINWFQSSLKEEALNRHVRRLLWDMGADIDVDEATDIRWSNEGEGAFPFDRGTAHLLYRELLEPAAALLEGKRHLFVVSAGALSSLPFGVLVTEEPQGKDGDAQALRETAWLADDHAIVQLPSLQSLQLLRAVGGDKEAEAGNSFLGFGDPVLAGYSVTRGTSKRQRRTRAGGNIQGAQWTRTASGAQRLASTDSLRALASLPGTRTELLAMQGIFGERNSRLFLGKDATETRFRDTDLGGASVISFATHGLVAGELEGLAEPGLVFTPPATPTDTDDGLLTSSEIAALELTADWVILSACNTASGDGTSGADGLSGLARSFFFAGAASLLVSHWPVSDEVAAIMTVRIFELQRDNPQWSRAEALHAAMRDIRDDPRKDGVGETWAHPSRWAPFAYIGDIRD